MLGGSVDDEDGAHPAVWRLTGAALSPPDVVDDIRGSVSAMAIDGDGEPVLLLTTPDGPAVATRAEWRGVDRAAAAGRR